MKPPWWFCCGWWSPWCVLDQAAHLLLVPRSWRRPICDRHDRQIMGDDFDTVTAADIQVIDFAASLPADEIDYSEFYVEDE